MSTRLNSGLPEIQDAMCLAKRIGLSALYANRSPFFFPELEDLARVNAQPVAKRLEDRDPHRLVYCGFRTFRIQTPTALVNLLRGRSSSCIRAIAHLRLRAPRGNPYA